MRLINQESIDVEKLKILKFNIRKELECLSLMLGYPKDSSIWLLLDSGNSSGVVVDRKVARKMGRLDNLVATSGFYVGVNFYFACSLLPL